MSLILSDAVVRALEEAGILKVEDHVTRVVIDLQVQQPPVIHIQRYGDSRMLKVIPALDGVEIRREATVPDLDPDEIIR